MSVADGSLAVSVAMTQTVPVSGQLIINKGHNNSTVKPSTTRDTRRYGNESFRLTGDQLNAREATTSSIKSWSHTEILTTHESRQPFGSPTIRQAAIRPDPPLRRDAPSNRLPPPPGPPTVAKGREIFGVLTRKVIDWIPPRPRQRSAKKLAASLQLRDDRLTLRFNVETRCVQKPEDLANLVINFYTHFHFDYN